MMNNSLENQRLVGCTETSAFGRLALRKVDVSGTLKSFSSQKYFGGRSFPNL
jgi:hypothetical protein